MIKALLSRRRKGAMAMVALAAMVPVSAMMAANTNTSQMVDDRRQAQDAADALANLHGAWTARALNIISMNNVTTAQLMSVAVGSEALFMTTTELTLFATLAAGHITGHGATHCPTRTPFPANLVEAVVWTAPCTAWHAAVGIPASLALARAADINSDFNPLHGIRTAEKALSAIDGMNKSLAARHPRAMAEIAEEYYALLEINDHHFADPCNGPDLRSCSTTNSNDGMSLPIQSATFEARMQLLIYMERGLTTTFNERGFGIAEGPLSHGGSRARQPLNQHINNITGIGNALHEFKRFYSRRISDLPRHPFTGPGTAQGNRRPQASEPEDEEQPFDDETKDVLDGLVDILDNVNEINEQVLSVIRNIPLNYDRHPTRANLVGTQGRRDNNSFFRNFSVLKGSILFMPPLDRTRIPLGVDLANFQGVTAVRVPEIYQLVGIDPNPFLNPLPPVEPRTMPEAFHILAYTLKEKSPRLSETIVPNSVTTHTGYGQAGVFNPDGATLFTQNWTSMLMPSSRLDDVRRASRDLARQARSGFDDLAAELLQVQHTQSWGRVHAH